ncbi:MAG: hypothetical protein ACRD1C_02390 [Terriglobales bacterium]
MGSIERALGVGALALGTLAAGGCTLLHRNPPLPPVVIVQPPLIFPAPPPAPMMEPAELTPVDGPAPVWEPVVVAPPPVERPRRAPEPARAEHPTPPPDMPPPPLNAGLSPREQFTYRGQTLAALQRVQRDLTLLSRRSLAPAAAATRAQAGEYVRQAQSALAQGDLVRAQTLANKAETLARFLLGQ